MSSLGSIPLVESCPPKSTERNTVQISLEYHDRVKYEIKEINYMGSKMNQLQQPIQYW